MKSTASFKVMAIVALLGAALAAPVMAQGGPGMGWGGGWGGGPGMWNSGPGAGYGGGMGHGGRGGRGMMNNQNGVPAWTLMTSEERTAFQIKMREVKTYDECKVVQTDHRNVMEARAKEKGVTIFTPRQFGCDNLKARGVIM